MFEEHQVNLFARYEQRLLSGDHFRPQVIPAVVITGFLGSGKTTLVHHILRNRGSLRIAVLVNEVGQLDVDSQLVNAKQGNAALGLPAVDLSGGCVCCSRAEDLAAALRQLRAPPAAAAAAGGGGASSSSSSAPCDYLLVETSGAADAGPLAEALVAGGFRLDAVVAVVDAEAGREALRHLVAHAQVSCADVVVINKCDLLAGVGGGLGALAELEDWLERAAPGVRLVRARYGEVPLTAVLDVEPVGAGDAAIGSGGGQAAAAASAGGAVTGGGGGGGGFMSHESMPSVSGASAGRYRPASGPLTADGLAVGSSRHAKRRVQAAGPRATAADTATTTATTTTSPATATAVAATSVSQSDHPSSHHGHQHHHQHHHLHGDQVDQGAGSAAQAPVGSRAGTGAALKAAAGGGGGAAAAAANGGGAADGGGHAALHSGFHTESLSVEGPASLVAFAGFVVRRLVREPALLRSKGVLWFRERRLHRFTFHLSGRRRVELCQEGPWEGPPACQLVLIGTDAAAMRRLREAFLTEVLLEAAAGNPPPPLVRQHNSAGGADGERGVEADATAAAGEQATAGVSGPVEIEAATRFIAANERLELLGCESWRFGEETSSTAVAAAAAAGAGGGGVVVQFTTRGSALHGINAEELNAELLRRANAGGRLLLAAVTAPGKISAVTNVQSRDRVLSLLMPCAVPEAHSQAAALLEVAQPLLRKAYAHVHNCKCDVASAMQASTR